MVVKSCRAPTVVADTERQDLSEIYRGTAVNVDRVGIYGEVTLRFSREFPLRWIITSNILLRIRTVIAG